MTMLELLIRLEEDAGLVDIYRDEAQKQLKVELLGKLPASLYDELCRQKDNLIRHVPTAKQIRPAVAEILAFMSMAK